MRPDEEHTATLVCTRAFASNSFSNFLGNVPRAEAPVPLPPRTTAQEKELPRAARTLYFFLGGLLRTTLLTCGRVMLCVRAGDPEEIVAVPCGMCPVPLRRPPQCLPA